MSLENIPFIFWNKNSQGLTHNITCVSIKDKKICTGSDSGELCIWSQIQDNFVPNVICTISKDIECRALAFITPLNPDLISCDQCIASLHADNIIRCWDIRDGRCLISSEKETLPNSTRLDMMITIQQRFLAISGEIVSIFLLDSWTMQILATYTMESKVSWISNWNHLGSDFLAGADLGGKIEFWKIEDLKNFGYGKDEFPGFKLDSLYKVYTDENPVSFCFSQTDSIMAIAHAKTIQFFHEDWIVSKVQEKAFLEMDKGIIAIGFSYYYFFVLLNDGVLLRYESMNILNEITEDEISLSRSGSKIMTVLANDEYNLNSLESEITYIDRELINAVFYNDFILSYKHQSIIIMNLLDFKPDKIINTNIIQFSLKSIGHESYADSRLHHLFKENEIITLSTIALTDKWPFYLIGTSLGNIYVCPFQPNQLVYTYSYHKAPITCIYLTKNKLVTCGKDNLMCLWSFSIENHEIEAKSPEKQSEEYPKPSRMFFRTTTSYQNQGSSIIRPEVKKNHPEQVIPIHTSPVKKVIEISILGENNSNSILDYWKRTLLSQCKDGSVLLISLITNSILCYFQPLQSNVIEAHLLLAQNYLFIICDNQKLYIFDTSIQALERIIPMDQIHIILNTEIDPPLSPVKEKEKIVSSFVHKLLWNHIKFQCEEAFKNPITVDQISIGGSEFPLLYINVSSAIKRIHENSLRLSEAEYLLGLITCWKTECKGHTSLKEYLKKYISFEEPLVSCHIGVRGYNNCYSFVLPICSDKYEISGYLTSSLLGSSLAFAYAFQQTDGATRRKLKQFMNSHLSFHENYKSPDFSALVIQYLNGNLASGFLIKQVLPYLENRKKINLVKSCIFLLENKPETDSKNVSFIEALYISILGLFCNENRDLNAKVVQNILISLRNMTKTGISHYVAIASKIIGTGIGAWRQCFTKEQIMEICREFLRDAGNYDSTYKKILYRGVTKIASHDFMLYLNFLSHDLEDMETNKKYPKTCLSSLKQLLIRKYEEFPRFLPDIIEVILKTLNPHNPILRKNCLEKASTLLKKLVHKLPMVAFSQTTQRLAIGTLDKFIVIYDLKTASQWKILEGHEDAVCAIDFDKKGHKIASYCAIGCTLRIFKIEKGFFHDILSSSSKPSKTLPLPKVVNSAQNYKEFLNIVKIDWTVTGDISLRREDGQAYKISL